VVFTGGLACLTLAASIFVVDVLGRDRFAKFGIVFGANAITIYVFASLMALVLSLIKIGGQTIAGQIMQIGTSIGLSAKLSSLVYALLFVAFCYIPAWILYRKKIFIKL
jgi:predicted acyltransferase